jgi:hypothetical protein
MKLQIFSFFAGFDKKRFVAIYELIISNSKYGCGAVWG